VFARFRQSHLWRDDQSSDLHAAALTFLKKTPGKDHDDAISRLITQLASLVNGGLPCTIPKTSKSSANIFDIRDSVDSGNFSPDEENNKHAKRANYHSMFVRSARSESFPRRQMSPVVDWLARNDAYVSQKVSISRDSETLIAICNRETNVSVFILYCIMKYDSFLYYSSSLFCYLHYPSSLSFKRIEYRILFRFLKQ